MNPIGPSPSSISSSSDLGAKLGEHHRDKHCPSCGHKLDYCKPDWVRLPAGVKFDPTDQELIEHLEAKVKEEGARSHPLIDEFIPTLDGEDGICYTHPEKLPGVTRDGLSKHFFHRPSKAYTTGTRKRRKIQAEYSDEVQPGRGSGGGETRWHKTGKTRPVLVGGRQKGCKKILVLYTNFGKHRKPEKTNWVMHQYHLGELEEEKDGELVVSKIFYQTQPRQCSWSASDRAAAAAGALVVAAAEAGVAGKDHELEMPAGAGMSGFGGAGEMVVAPARLKAAAGDHFSFDPFRKSFEEVGMEEVATKGRDDQAVTSTAFLIGQPTINPAVLAPPLQHSVVLDDNPYHHHHHHHQLSDILRPAKFQHQQQQHQQHLHHKLDHRSASGLEELIMGCTSATSKADHPASIPQAQDQTEWPYSYWPPPDNPNHHG